MRFVQNLRRFVTLALILVMAGTPFSIAPVRLGSAMPSLTFGGATSDRCEATTSSAMNNLTTFTFGMWVYPTTLTGNRQMWRKDSNPATANFKNFRLLTTDATAVNFQISRATSNAIVTTATGTVAVNTWYFFAGTYNEGDGPKLYKRTLTTDLAEVSYAGGFPIVGTGSTTTDGAVLWFGNQPGAAPSLAFQGRISTAIWFNRVLTLNEIRTVAMKPFCSSGQGCVGYWQLGWAGTGTQPDLSGNGSNCTVTGATVSPHAPIAR